MTMNIEYIIDQAGGFGKFQLMVVTAVFGMKFFAAWSMMQMAVAGIIPDFHCGTTIDDVIDQNTTLYNYNRTDPEDSLNECTLNGSSCKEHRFDTSIRSIINEWDLVCDLSWVKATTTSVQMAGVLIGALVAGQLGDLYGRKKTTYGYYLAHLVFNVVIVFSNSWQMFMAFRFLIGMGIGGILVMCLAYPIEFVPQKRRVFIPPIPMWASGVCLFSLMAYLLENWKHLHMALAAFSAPMLLGWFVVPESLRWLTVHGRTDEAYKTLEKMASMNGRSLPDDTVKVIEIVAEEEKTARENGQKYTYMDIFRGSLVAKNTLSLAFMWCAMSIATYGIGFGVSGIGGNPYLNLFLLHSLNIPAIYITYYFTAKFGRRKTSGVLYIIGVVSSFGVMATDMAGPESNKSFIIIVLSLIAKSAVSSAWAVSQLWVFELYPTVTRNLGYGFANTSARIGGIIAPFAIDLDDRLVLSYILIGSLMLVSAVLSILCQETKGVELSDSIVIKVKGSNRTNVEAPGVVKEDNNVIFSKPASKEVP